MVLGSMMKVRFSSFFSLAVLVQLKEPVPRILPSMIKNLWWNHTLAVLMMMISIPALIARWRCLPMGLSFCSKVWWSIMSLIDTPFYSLSSTTAVDSYGWVNMNIAISRLTLVLLILLISFYSLSFDGKKRLIVSSSSNLITGSKTKGIAYIDRSV